MGFNAVALLCPPELVCTFLEIVVEAKALGVLHV